jgi:stress response protein YsnF
MTLSEMDNFNDRQPASNENIHDFDVYGEQNEKIGKVVRVEMAGLEPSPHLVIKVGSWLANRQVLLPLHSYRVDRNTHRLYIERWSRDLVNQLPTYHSQTQVEDAYTVLETSVPLESEVPLEAPLEAPFIREMHPFTIPLETPHFSQRTPAPAFTANDTTTQDTGIQLDSTAKILAEEIIPLWAERLIVDRHKRKSGEVVIRKVIETEVIEVIVRREKLIVEQVSPEYKELAVIDLGRTSVEETVPSQAKNNAF